MDNIVIGNATYLVNRVFIGNKKVSEIIQSKVENTNFQALPLTNTMPASYNEGGRSEVSWRNHEN